MRALTILFLLAVAGAVGCGAAAPPREASITVNVTDDQGLPLGGIAVLVDDTPIATTNAAGQARTIVQATKSGRVHVKASCPSQYRDAESRSVLLSRADAQAPSLALRMTCTPKLRTLAVVVRAPGGEGLTLRADGAPVAKIAADGTAHLVLQRAPESSLRLTLDTTDAPKLWPQFPARELRVTDRDEILVFDQTLATRAPRAHRVKVKQAPVAQATPARHVPYAIGRR